MCMAFYSYDRVAQFSDSDAAGFIHFSRLACFVEEAEHAFLARSGYPVQVQNPEAYRWPRIQFQANFNCPIFPFDSIRVDLQPGQVGKSSVLWKWTIWKDQVDSPAAGGEMKTVCCQLRNGQIEAVPLPDDLRALLLSV
jgi:acyl-CoA thioesterase FadM